jgi:predicted small integral membrane protein
MHVKYLIKNQNGGMAATLMTCHRHFFIWSSVSGRWFEIWTDKTKTLRLPQKWGDIIISNKSCQ